MTAKKTPLATVKQDAQRQSAELHAKMLLAWLALMRIPTPEPEYRFSPERKWRVDWAWPDARVALEVEGGLFGIGKPCPVCKQRKVAGHTSIERLLTDQEKYNALAALGWRLLRIRPGDFTYANAELITRTLGATDDRS